MESMDLPSLPDDMIIAIAPSLDYPTLLKYGTASGSIWRLIRHLLPGKFVEYIKSSMRFISAGGKHTAFITNQGKLYVMGDNTYGQLGLGDVTHVTTPTFTMEYDILSVSAGGSHTAFINKRRQLYVMGRNRFGRLGLDHTNDDVQFPKLVNTPKVVSVSTGKNHTAFITDQGQLYTMGSNLYGQLGLGFGHSTEITTPTLVKEYSYSSTDVTIPALIEPKVIAVSAGGFHTAFITDQGQLYVMGFNGNGQLGLGHRNDIISPTPVENHTQIRLQPFKIVAVSAGSFHTAFITDQGQLYVMGSNTYGQLGLGHKNAILYPTLLENFKVAAVSAGGDHTAFITDQGELYVMGSNIHGQIGLGQIESVASPTRIRGLRVIAVSAGVDHTALVTLQGDVYAMGYNDFGQLGINQMNDVSTPTKITIKPSTEYNDLIDE